MRLSTVLLAAASTIAIAAPAAADTVIALLDTNELALIDTETMAVTETVAITDADGLLGIDVRPADGMLYGLTAAGTVVSIDPMTGAATEISTLSEMLDDGVTAVVDFNPLADRLRVIGSDGTSLRINVADGATTVDTAVNFAATDAMAGQTPAIIAGAYTNSAVGPAPEATQLFDIDATGTLLLQAPPNDGVLNTVGMLAGVEIAAPVGFDIGTLADGSNVGWLMAGDMLYSVNLDTGETAAAGTVTGLDGAVTDIAVWTE